MATQDQGNSGVPQFLTKLWLLVEDSCTNHLIQWGEEGTTFLVLDQPQFAKEVLPQFFKHNNMASFVRQLNMYGFRKKANIEQGALKSVREDVEFVHPHFIRGQPGLLELIKRKVSSKEEPKVKTEEVNKILSDVKGMKTKQEDINGTLDSMKRENQALWSEVMILRQRHDKQQKVVNRLIQFLLTLVNPVGVNKRKQQLAIEPGVGGSGGPSKQAKYGRQISLHAGNLEDLINLQTASNLDAPGTRLSDIVDNHNTSGCGVTVSEVTSPLEPNARALPDPSQTQAGFDGSMISASTPAVPVSVSSETVPGTSGLSDIQSLPVSDLVTPLTLSMIPELGDIATMPLSDILAPSTESEPIVTSPPPSVEQTLTTPILNDDGLSVPASQGENGLELIPKESSDFSQMGLLQHPHAGILQRALSTEEIEQKEQLGTDLNTLQANIESIQSLLSGNASLTVDPDVLLGVFSHGGGVDDSNLFDLSTDTYDFNPANFTGTGPGSGTEMIEYNPGLSPFAAAAGMGISAVDASDDDSLLQSLNEDSRLLAKNRVVQEEVD